MCNLVFISDELALSDYSMYNPFHVKKFFSLVILEVFTALPVMVFVILIIPANKEIGWKPVHVYKFKFVLQPV